MHKQYMIDPLTHTVQTTLFDKASFCKKFGEAYLMHLEKKFRRCVRRRRNGPWNTM